MDYNNVVTKAKEERATELLLLRARIRGNGIEDFSKPLLISEIVKERVTPTELVTAGAIAWTLAAHDEPGYCEDHLFRLIASFAGPTWVGKADQAMKKYSKSL